MQFVYIYLLESTFPDDNAPGYCRSQPLAKNVGSGTDSVLDLFTWNVDVMK